VTVEVVPFNRTLEQELQALLRGASLECLVCGEFVLHKPGAVACGECGSWLPSREEERAAPAPREAGAEAAPANLLDAVPQRGARADPPARRAGDRRGLG
jgi:hypothetical protein